MRLWRFGSFMQLVEIFGYLGNSGGVVHFAICPFDGVGVFKETALWWTSITVLTRARSTASLVIGATGWICGCRCGIIIVTGEGNAIGTRSLAFVITQIVFLGWISIIMALKKFLRSSTVLE